MIRAVVVEQLAEQSLPTPENMGLNPAINSFYKIHLFTVKWRGERKRGWEWPIKNYGN